MFKKFTSNVYELFYACHVLEHFAHDEVLGVLKSWARVLKSEGEIYISVPDIDRIVKIYFYNWDHFQTKGNTPWIGLVYRGQTDQYDFHKTGFNFNWFSY
jgi:predicted SAM-dependent methyltransferase